MYKFKVEFLTFMVNKFGLRISSGITLKVSEKNCILVHD